MGRSAVPVRAGGRREAAPRGAPVFPRQQQLLGAGHLPLQRPGLARHFGGGGRAGPGQRLRAAPRFGGALGGDPPIVGGREGADAAVQCPRQGPAGCGTEGGSAPGVHSLWCSLSAPSNPHQRNAATAPTRTGSRRTAARPGAPRRAPAGWRGRMAAGSPRSGGLGAAGGLTLSEGSRRCPTMPLRGGRHSRGSLASGGTLRRSQSSRLCSRRVS